MLMLASYVRLGLIKALQEMWPQYVSPCPILLNLLSAVRTVLRMTAVFEAKGRERGIWAAASSKQGCIAFG